MDLLNRLTSRLRHHLGQHTDTQQQVESDMQTNLPGEAMNSMHREVLAMFEDTQEERNRAQEISRLNTKVITNMQTIASKSYKPLEKDDNMYDFFS